MNILSINLSNTRHFDIFGFQSAFYIGPTVENDYPKGQLKTSNHIILSEWLSKISKLEQIDFVILFVDPFAYTQTGIKIEIDTHKVPVVALIGDTHHGPDPIRRVVSFLHENKIRKVILKQTRHQKYIYQKCGLEVLPLPYYLVNPIISKPRIKTHNRALFAGNTSDYHFHRTILLKELYKNNLVDIYTLPRDLTFKFYNRYSVSINTSLCSDTNLRIHEVVAAGGCLLTDCLPEISKEDEILIEGEDYLSYSSIKECKECIHYLTSNSEARYKIAVSGHNRLIKAVNSHKIARLIENFAFNGASKNESFCLSEFARSDIQQYEDFQTKYKDSSSIQIPMNYKKLFSITDFNN